jgi:multicomponent Na+:H+ antiporter subunit B
VRAFDTLGEEFILFASVSGVALLLRHLRDEDGGTERRRTVADHQFAGASDALRVLSLILIPLLVSLGVYLALHGALTPGGGFQAGVVLAAGPLAALLGGRYLALKRVAPRWALEALDSIGATAYAAIGLGGLIFASTYLENYLPLGTSGHLLSAGMMPLNSIAVGLEVTGAFLLTWTEFLDQDVVVERGEL